MSWPPSLAELKEYANANDERDDVTLAVALEAAIDYVEDALAGAYNFSGATTGAEALLPVPPQRVVYGTIREAARQHNLRRSPDGTIDMGEAGVARIPVNDPAIERLLGIGRWRPPMVG